MTPHGGLLLSRACLRQSVAEVQRFGRKHVETGGFYLASNERPRELVVVALAREHGIVRHTLQFTMSGIALARLFEWAADQNLCVVAQFHSHAGEAFLSGVDRDHGLSVRDFTTTVIPTFANPPGEPAVWGWWRFDGQEWVVVTPPAVVDLRTRRVEFDESGIYER